MSGFAFTAGGERFQFADLKQLLAKATPAPPATSWPGLPPTPACNAWPRRWRLPIYRCDIFCRKQWCRTKRMK